MLYPLNRLYVRLCILQWDEKFWAWIGGKFDGSNPNPYKTPLKYSTEMLENVPIILQLQQIIIYRDRDSVQLLPKYMSTA